MEGEENGKVTVSTGVVFTIKDVPVMAFDAIKRALYRERPQVPVRYLAEKDRDEPCPDDPEYLLALDMWESDLNEKLVDAAVIIGLELDHVPEGVYKVEDIGWTVDLTRVGIEIALEGDERYLAWVKLYAAPSLKDLQTLIKACSRNAGVTEEDVADLADTFPNRAERRAHRKTLRQARS